MTGELGDEFQSQPESVASLLAALGDPALAIKDCGKSVAFEGEVAVQLLWIKEQEIARFKSNGDPPTRQYEVAACEFPHRHKGAHDAGEVATVEVIRGAEVPGDVDRAEHR